MSPETVSGAVERYGKVEERDEYSEPGLANSDWWSNAPVQSILNVYGGYEVFRDDISKLSRALIDSGNSVQDSECAMHVHIDNVLDAQTGMEPGEMAKVIWKWLGQVV